VWPVALLRCTYRDPVPFRDALIGATALVHGMTIVTRDLEDFQRFDQIDILNPWT
jgi:predicted nucleic acid-binding protein